MKASISIVLFLSLINPIICQIVGNGKMTEKRIQVAQLENIDVQFNAKITLDYDQEEWMTIQADENVIDYIGITYEEGTLLLDQVKWIEPSKQPTITIGCPMLKTIFQGTHSKTTIKNVRGPLLNVQGNVGTIKIEGDIEVLLIHTENSDVDAKELAVRTVSIGDHCKSTIMLNTFDTLVKSESSKPNITSNMPSHASKVSDTPVPEVTFISLVVKNNSIRRNNFYVTGPNGRGGTFSYGFSIFPFLTKKKRWSVGTTVYKESSHGKLEKLLTITADNADQTVKLF